VRAPSDPELADALDRFARMVFRHRRGVVAAAGITPALARALQRLGADPPRAMSELAGVLDCDPSNVTGIVDRLEARGLVERRATAGDRRVKTVAITAEGATLLKQLRRELSTLPPALAALNPSDRDQLRGLLALTEETH